MSILRPWFIVIGLLACVVLGPFLYVYATLSPRMELLGPITPESPIGIAYSAGGAAYRAGNYQKAVDIYTDYLAHESNTNWYARTIFAERARAYEAMREYYRAEADLTETMKLAPKTFAYSTYADRGAFYGRLGRDDLALADFAAGRKLDPKNGVFDYREALMDEARGDYKKAVGKFTEAIRLEPKRRQYYTARGSAYNNAEMYNEARADYSHALTIVEKYTSARETVAANYGRGYAELHLGLYQQALDDFDVVLKVTPRLSNMLAWQGSAYEGLGDTERAIAAYKAALEIDPKQERALEKLKSLQPAQ